MSRTFIRRRTNVTFSYSTVNCEEMLTVVIAILFLLPTITKMLTFKLLHTEPLTAHTGHGEK